MKFEEPEIIYKDLLDKGEDLTTKEVIYLRMKGVDKTVIRKATKLKREDLETILKNSDSVIQNHKKAVDEMAGKTTKFNMTPERAKQLKAEGKNKTEIAKIAGVSPATYTYHEKKWEGKTESSEKIAPLKVKDAAPERDHAEYTMVINALKEKLRYSRQVEVQKDKRIHELEQEKKDLHAAANDTESELLTDADIWKQQAQMYQAENKRLNENLSELREELAKYKGMYVLSTGLLKAVL